MIVEEIKDFWNFLKKDTWQSWVVSLILMVLVIKLVIFPSLNLITGTSHPLLVVESCSMYHSQTFYNWWGSHGVWYEKNDINESSFSEYSFKNGLNKGDIVIVVGRDNFEEGDVIVFNSNNDSLSPHPIIHRIIKENPIGTKGDNNPSQLTKENNLLKVDETDISKEQILGKAVVRIPAIGWVKLIFFEPLRSKQDRGLCKQN